MTSDTFLGQRALADACELPSYHIADRIQPHTVLLSVDLARGIVVRASANCGEIFGVPAEEMLGTPTSDWIAFDATLGQEARQIGGTIEVRRPTIRRVEAWSHPDAGCLCFEILLPTDRTSTPMDEFEFSANLSKIARAEGSPQEIAQHVCAALHAITGFDRIYLCTFDDTGHGRVPAEHRSGHFPSLLDHHFPRTDMPERVRRLYRTQRFRLIPDVDAEPVPVLSVRGVPAMLDMSYSTCREVAASHVDYLRNMGVVASVSFGVMDEDRLTALFGGHNPTPRRLSCLDIKRCLRLVEAYANRIAALELHAQQLRQRGRRADLSRLVETFAASRGDFFDFAAAHPRALAELLDADGIVVVDGARVFSDQLAKDDAQTLAAWCMRRLEGRDHLATSTLSAEAPAFARLAREASGVLAVSVAGAASDAMLAWVRREIFVERKWGGDPAQKLRHVPAGHTSPRLSFETYVEQLKGTARPWEPSCVELATNLKSACNRILASHYARRAQEEAERANRMMSEFLANVSHELRTPMHSIIGFSEALIDRADSILPERRRQYLEIVLGSGRRLLALINDLLQLSKMEAGASAPVLVEADILDCVRDAMAEIRPIAERKNVRLRGPGDATLPVFAFDRAMIMRLLVNLLSNAVQYTPEAGRVTITIAEGRMRRDGGACCEIVVADTGVGIPTDELEVIFDKFVQSSKTKNNAGGTGLGLPICRRIAEDHGGEIWAESPPWGGARFVAQLPLRAAAGRGGEAVSAPMAVGA
jgi:chemotaxis family two-component system sensor kinase Cph1